MGSSWCVRHDDTNIAFSTNQMGTDRRKPVAVKVWIGAYDLLVERSHRTWCTDMYNIHIRFITTMREGISKSNL